MGLIGDVNHKFDTSFPIYSFPHLLVMGGMYIIHHEEDLNYLWHLRFDEWENLYLCFLNDLACEMLIELKKIMGAWGCRISLFHCICFKLKLGIEVKHILIYNIF